MHKRNLEKDTPINKRKIILAISHEFGLLPEEIYSPPRGSNTCQRHVARKLLSYFLYKHTAMTYPEIGLLYNRAWLVPQRLVRNLLKEMKTSKYMNQLIEKISKEILK